jgi:hypothetical protein
MHSSCVPLELKLPVDLLAVERLRFLFGHTDEDDGVPHRRSRPY